MNKAEEEKKSELELIREREADRKAFEKHRQLQHELRRRSVIQNLVQNKESVANDLRVHRRQLDSMHQEYHEKRQERVVGASLKEHLPVERDVVNGQPHHQQLHHQPQQPQPQQQQLQKDEEDHIKTIRSRQSVAFRLDSWQTNRMAEDMYQLRAQWRAEEEEEQFQQSTHDI